MSNEITHNFETGKTLYACRFNENGNVYQTSPSTNEPWGTGGRTVTDYKISMWETGVSGTYKGDFASGGTFPEGTYYVTVYEQLTTISLDSDPAIGQGTIHWDGTEEIDPDFIYEYLP